MGSTPTTSTKGAPPGAPSPFNIYPRMVGGINIRTAYIEGSGAGAIDIKDSLENLIIQNALPSTLLSGQTYSVDPSITFLVISTDRLASANYLQPDGLYMSLRGASYSGSGQWLDSSGNGVNADIVGASFSSSENVFILDGTDELISVPADPQMGMTSSRGLTLQLWVNVAWLPPTNFIPLFGKLSTSYEFDGYFCAVNADGTLKAFTNGRFRQRDTDSEVAVTLGAWHMVTFITQLSANADTTKVYLDKQLAISTHHGADDYSESNNLTFGSIGQGLGYPYLNGRIGEVHFYTRSLTQNEVFANYDFTKSKYGL